MADISAGLSTFPLTSTWASPLGASTILYGSLFPASETSFALNLRPISLLIEKMVFSGLVMPCLFAMAPTSLSPLSVKATTEGVVLLPSALGMTTGSPPVITATHEFVVPRSIPITFPIIYFLLSTFQHTLHKVYNHCVCGVQGAIPPPILPPLSSLPH